MYKLNRREVLGLTAAVGLAASSSADVTRAKDRRRDRWGTERKRVEAVGLTEAEADCWVKVAQAAAAFFTLPELHELDGQEVSQAIHVIQYKLLARPAYRQYLGLAKKNQ